MSHKNDPDIIRTTNPECPSCRQKVLHSETEMKQYHPLNRTGVDNRNKEISKIFKENMYKALPEVAKFRDIIEENSKK